MRIAVVSDMHANLTALDAVITDLRKAGASLVVHGGDLMSGGPRPAEVIGRVREMNWPGVYGNTDEMLWMPHRVSETLDAPHLHRIRDLLLDLIRFRGHFPKGGYDVHDGLRHSEATFPTQVL